jgi:hypothetical protein
VKGDHRSHVLGGVKSIVSFPRRLSKKSDTAIKAALSYLWSKQMDKSDVAFQKEREKRLN